MSENMDVVERRASDEKERTLPPCSPKAASVPALPGCSVPSYPQGSVGACARHLAAFPCEMQRGDLCLQLLQIHKLDGVRPTLQMGKLRLGNIEPVASGPQLLRVELGSGSSGS